MAETDESAAPCGADMPDSLTYKTPAPKTLKEIQEMDKDDPSLAKYKMSLLGDNAEATGEGPDVVLQSLALVVEDEEKVIIDLTGDLSQLKDKVHTIKEGIGYKARLAFLVKDDIVSGLKYQQTPYYKSTIKGETSTYMIGSYPPRKEAHVFTASVDELTPKGVLSRGHYTVQSQLRDDDGREFLSWEWAFDLKKDWE